MSEKKSMVTDLTEGSIPRLLLRFALPLFASNALQAVYNIVDMVVVGRVIGGSGMSAVSIGGDVLHLMTFIAMGFSSAGQVIIARDVGAGRMDRVKKTIGNLFSFLLSAALLMTVVCLILRSNILDWLNTPAESYAYTMDYTVTCMLGLLFIYGYNVVSAILRGMGDSKRPFVFIGVAAVLNIILDIVFVAFFGMEVFGAALATVIGQGVSFVASVVYLVKHREQFGFDFRPESFRPEKQTLRRLLALGIPMSIQSAAVNFSKIVLTAWINDCGVIYSALSGVYNKIGMMAGIASNSFTTAGSTMVGQNLGAGKYERVPKILRVVLIIGLGMASVGTLAMLTVSGPIFHMFTKDAEVLAETAILVFPVIVNLFGCATRSMAFAIINGSGNSNLNLAVAILDGMISRIGLAALLGFSFGMACKGFWLGDAYAGFMPFVIGSVYLFSGKWKSSKKN